MKAARRFALVIADCLAWLGTAVIVTGILVGVALNATSRAVRRLGRR